MTRKRPKIVKKHSKVKFSVQALGGLSDRKKGVTSVVDVVFLSGSPTSMPALPALAPRTEEVEGRPAQATAAAGIIIFALQSLHCRSGILNFV